MKGPTGYKLGQVYLWGYMLEDWNNSMIHFAEYLLPKQNHGEQVGNALHISLPTNYVSGPICQSFLVTSSLRIHQAARVELLIAAIKIKML